VVHHRILWLLLPAFFCSWTAFRRSTLDPVATTTFKVDLDAPIPVIGRRGSATATRTSYANDFEDCFALNSQSWLKGPRIGNSLDLDFVFAPQDEDTIERILQEQSLCGTESPFASLQAVLVANRSTETTTTTRAIEIR